MSRTVTVPRGDFTKYVEPGDIVDLHGRSRMIVDVGRNCIAFVRFRSSYIWRGSERNATVWWDLPIRVTVLRRATDETRLLAERFLAWFEKPVPQKAWERVCALSVAAIKCECEAE